MTDEIKPGKFEVYVAPEGTKPPTEAEAEGWQDLSGSMRGLVDGINSYVPNRADRRRAAREARRNHR